MNATALLLFALFIVLAGLHLLRHQYNWIEYSIAGIAIVLSVIASTARPAPAYGTKASNKSYATLR